MTTFAAFTSNPTFYGVTALKAVPASKNNTDVIAPDVKLYIEGVQVPFEAISINQSYNSLPTAEIQVPPSSGLIDITRGYEPKVHVFYKDDNYGGYRLLFWGHIKSTSYGRSRSQGSTSISFHCEHKNAILSQVTMDFTGWANQNSDSATDPGSNGGVTKPPAFSSMMMVVEAMGGIEGVATTDEKLSPFNEKIFDAPVNKLDPSLSKLENRLSGMPGVAVNLWNQLKRGAYLNKVDNISLTSLYIPVIEEGIGFFKRMSGHPLLEQKLQNSKQPFCQDNSGSKSVNIIVPPCSRVSLVSAVQRDLTVRNLSAMSSMSGEMTSFHQLMQGFMEYSKYDVNTLASPAEINANPGVYIEDVNSTGVEKSTVETILKPQIPFYYSPICNVLLPRMYHSIQVNQVESSVPTRITVLHDAMPGASSNVNTSFKAPSSVREAVAYNSLLIGKKTTQDLKLSDTMAYSFHIPGKHETGTGIRHMREAIPWWLAIIMGDENLKGESTQREEVPAKGTEDYNQLMFLNSEWRSRYGVDVKYGNGDIQLNFNAAKNNLNPYDPSNTTLLPYQRTLLGAVDIKFSEKVAESRTGSIDALFNPYIIPGYPMDVIDDSPNHPSFHGYCTSVTHTITARSISTSIGMVSVTTYAELSNYYIPPVAPYLQSALNMINGTINQDLYNSTPANDPSPFSSSSSVLIQNPVAKATADTFYKQVLGVGSISPDDLIHFASGRAYPLYRRAGLLIPRLVAGAVPNIKPHHAVTPHSNSESRINDDYYTSVGNLRMVSRPIESKESISSKFGYNFIDLDRDLYNDSFINYVNPTLASNLFLEPGASLFLDYMETEDFINAVKSKINLQ